MPELNVRAAYFVILAVMVLIVILLLFIMRKQQWIYYHLGEPISGRYNGRDSLAKY